MSTNATTETNDSTPDDEERARHCERGQVTKKGAFSGYRTGRVEIALLRFFEKHRGRVSNRMMAEWGLDDRDVRSARIQGLRKYLQKNECATIGAPARDRNNTAVYWYYLTNKIGGVLHKMVKRQKQAIEFLNKQEEDLILIRAIGPNEEQRALTKRIALGGLAAKAVLQRALAVATDEGIGLADTGPPDPVDMGHVHGEKTRRRSDHRDPMDSAEEAYEDIFSESPPDDAE